jgi:transposase
MEEIIACPDCAQTTRQLRVGRNRSGSQRYRCAFCQRKYTPQPTRHGYDEALRRQAIEWYIDGMGLRRIARHLHVVHQTVANWVAAHAATLPDAPPLPPTDAQQPLTPLTPLTPLAVVELDELYTFAGQKNSASTSSRR